MAKRGSRNCPPSEKESGVTFTTPITSVRSPSASRRERNCQVNLGRVAMRNSVLVVSRVGTGVPARAKFRMEGLSHPEEELHILYLGRLLVCRQAIEKNPSIGF